MRKEPSLRTGAERRISDELDQHQGGLFDSPEPHSEDQLLADYRQRYGLSEDPFSNDYSFPLFTGAGRRQLLDQLIHLSQFSNSLLLVLGEYGSGKTRIAHGFMDSLSERDQVCFLTLRSGQPIEETLLSIVQALALPLAVLPTAENLVSCLDDFLADEPAQKSDGLAVVVIDNAHLLDDKTITVIGSLLDSFPLQSKLHFVWFGEPQLLSRVERLTPEAILINDFQVQTFSLAESVDYLNFRMEMADYLGAEIFSETIVDPWWRQAQGQLGILHELAQERLLESVTPRPSNNRRPLPMLHIIAISMLIALVGVLFLYMDDDKKITPEDKVVVLPAPVVETSREVVSNSSRDKLLASTNTPIEPILPSLPAPVASATASPVEEPEAIASEEIFPLVNLPVSPPKTEAVAPVSEPSPAANTPAPEPIKTQPAPVVTAEPVATARKIEIKSTAFASGKSVQEQTILGWPNNHFTIQLLGVSTERAARAFMAEQQNKQELLMFKSKRQGRDWFVVISGHFATSALARQSITRLPVSQRDAGPWPRDLKTIQFEIKNTQ